MLKKFKASEASYNISYSVVGLSNFNVLVLSSAYLCLLNTPFHLIAQTTKRIIHL